MSFLKDLEKLCQPAPVLPDTEDGFREESNIVSGLIAETDDNEGPTLRKRFGGIELSDPRYQGATISSKAIFGDMAEPRDFTNGDIESGASDDGSEYQEDDNDEFSIDADIDEENTDQSGSEESKDDEDDDQEENAREDFTNGTEIDDLQNDDDSPIVLKPVSVEHENKKAVAVRRQMTIFDQLLYLKIKMHAAMRLYNELPRGKLAQELLKNSDADTKKNYTTAKKNAARLVTTLLAAEEILLSSCPQAKGILNGDAKGAGKEDSEDEEIESSEDEKDEQEENDEPIPNYNFGSDYESDGDDIDAEVVKNGNTPNLSHAEIGRRLAQSDKKFDAFRRSTIEKWCDRTRLTTPNGKKEKKGDMSAFEDGVLSQIDKILRDKQRLIRRTRTKRSDVERIGGNPDINEDAETFDDNDFYQIMLKELIEKKSAQVIDPVAMTRQWLELQKLRDNRGKKKYKNLNTAKGRKIRYQVVPKLVNFHAAVPESVTWSHETRNELFKSLFAS